MLTINALSSRSSLKDRISAGKKLLSYPQASRGQAKPGGSANDVNSLIQAFRDARSVKTKLGCLEKLKAHLSPREFQAYQNSLLEPIKKEAIDLIGQTQSILYQSNTKFELPDLLRVASSLKRNSLAADRIMQNISAEVVRTKIGPTQSLVPQSFDENIAKLKSLTTLFRQIKEC